MLFIFGLGSFSFRHNLREITRPRNLFAILNYMRNERIKLYKTLECVRRKAYTFTFFTTVFIFRII